MYEDDIFSPDQEEIFKDDFACLQAINLTAFTTGDLVFMCVKESMPVWWCPRNMVDTWNTLVCTYIVIVIYTNVVTVLESKADHSNVVEMK